MKKAYFAGGCFWCITPCFYELEGVEDVIAGYSGGDEDNPTYEQVKHQQTLHRETVCICYDGKKLSYGKLLQTFLDNIDPYDEGGQFIDRGRSYTTAVYYADEAEYRAACAALSQLESREGRKSAVAIEPFKSFCTAEEYHQNYFRTHPEEFARELEESGRNAWKAGE